MRLRFATFSTVVVCTLALAACGGGGGSPTPTGGNTSDRPHASGDTFAYAGALVERFERAPLLVGVVPSPNPTNSATVSLAVAQTVTVGAPVASSGTASGPTTAYTTAETDTQAAPSVVTQSTTTETYAFAPVGASTGVRLLSSHQATDGATFDTTYGANDGLVDVIPDVAGPLTPANDAARSTTEHDAQGSTTTRVTNADGTYTLTTTAVDAPNGTASVAADGSGSYTFPLLYGSLASTETTFTVGAATGGSIPATIVYAAGIADPSKPVTLTGTIPVWYPLPLVLASSSLVDNGVSTPPAACALSGAASTNAHAVVAISHQVDPVFGETDDRTTTTYDVAGMGVACVQLTDRVAQYYDFSSQSQFPIATTADGAPLQTTTTTETLGLTQATVVGLDAAMRRGRSPGTAVVRASVARFERFLAAARTTRRTAALNAFSRRFR